MTQLFLPTGFEDDLKLILELDDAALSKIAELMDTETAVGAMVDVARRLAEESDVPPYSAHLTVQVVRYLAGQKRDCGLDENHVIDELARAFPALAELIGQRKESLIALLSEKPRAKRLRKRDRLSRGIVKTLVDVDGYCDLRPIFDAEKTTIVDQVSVVLVRLHIEDDAREDESVVLQLNEDSLEKLEKFLAETRRKLDCLAEAYPRIVQP